MIRKFFKSSENMSEVATGSVQLVISAFPSQTVYLFARKDCDEKVGHDELVADVKRLKYLRAFMLLNGPVIRNYYRLNILEIERCLTWSGVFVLNVGNANIKVQKDVFGTELTVLYPYMIAEDIVQISNLRLRMEHLSTVKVEGAKRIERWFVFSKTSVWKQNKTRMPLILKGEATSIPTVMTPFPENIVELFIKRFTDENDWVLDAYAGSGTAGIVANHLNRNAILYENDLNAWKVLCSRVGLT